MGEGLHSPLLARTMSWIGSTVGSRLACLPTGVAEPKLSNAGPRLAQTSPVNAGRRVAPLPNATRPFFRAGRRGLSSRPHHWRVSTLGGVTQDQYGL